MIPNFFPIVLDFGITRAFGIPLDTGNALIAAIALSIAMGDTMRFLSECQRRRGQRRSVSDALHAASQGAGPVDLFRHSVYRLWDHNVESVCADNFFSLFGAIIILMAFEGDLVALPAITTLKSKRADGVG